jgi:L-threonylcarbamoyladenylate synthase
MIPDAETLATALRDGGIALLPTDTIYGLHALANDRTAIEKLIVAKNRDDGKPFVVLGSSLRQLEALGAQFVEPWRSILDKIWPAPLTAVVRLDSAVAASRGNSTLAVRVPDIDWLRDVIEQTGPIASTSVNRSGETPLISLDGLSSALQTPVDVVVDVGPLDAKPSTIVDFTGDEPRLIREGESLFTQKVWKSLRKSL